MDSIFITGASGFIGSNLAERLLADGNQVTGWDNFSTGYPKFIEGFKSHKNFKFIKGDNLDLKKLTQAMKGSNLVFHLAANADVRFGLEHPKKDLEQNTIATFNVLEAMRANKIKKIFFSSTGSVYGESPVIPTPEDAPFPVQTSLYGASKLAGEGLIEAYCEGYQMEGVVLRFVSILGERYSHGHVFDFYKQLLEHPDRLKVLGDGTQRKSYLHIKDCINAMIHIWKHREKNNKNNRVDIYNLGTPEYCTIKDSILWICEYLKLNPKLEFGGGRQGWIGDNPFIFLNTSKIQSTGWKSTLSIKEAVTQTVEWLSRNKWILERK